MAYQGRILDSGLDHLLQSLPALAIEGPKGVGKTEAASRRAATIRKLDEADSLELAHADPRRLLQAETPVRGWRLACSGLRARLFSATSPWGRRFHVTGRS